MRALIGFSGFVGSTLRRHGHYDCLFNSTNSEEMRGRSFSDVVCAGVSAAKWKANKEPGTDWLGIQRLMDNLSLVEAKRFVLISTIDVYQAPTDVTEADSPPLEGPSAYGVNRALLERWITNNFGFYTIIRLPALYGHGLKKNAVYDLQNDNLVENIDPTARYQWYDVSRLEADMFRILESRIRCINITSEPIAMKTIGDRFFPGKLRPRASSSTVPAYDVRTQYARVLGGEQFYHFRSDQVLAGLCAYLTRT